MNANNLTFIRSAGLVAGAMLALSSVSLLGGEKSSTEAFPNFDSYIKVTGQAASVSGDGAAFASRAKQPENGGGGIEDLHYSKDVAKDTNMSIDGHALAGTEDYLGAVKFSKNEVGSFEVGYKRFRTFYDGVGGFFSNNAANYYPGTTGYYPGAATTYNKVAYTPTATYLPWQPLAKELLALDRSKFWVDAIVALPNMPVFEVKYTNELRDGKKDSTIWGQTDFTGLPTSAYLANPVSQARGILPSWIVVSERHENLEASVRHTVKNVTMAVSVFTDKTNNYDTRYVNRYLGETKIFAVPSSVLTGKLVSSVNDNNQIFQYQSDGMAAKTNGASGKLDIAFSDKLTLKFSGAYESVSNIISGDRPLVTWTPTNATVIPTGPNSTGVVPVATDNNQGLYGTVKEQEVTGKAALEWKPMSELLIALGLKTEKSWFHSDGGFTAVSSAQNATTGAITYTSVARTIFARDNNSGSTPVAEVRYTGIKNMAIYFTGSDSDVSGNESNFATYTPSTLVTSNLLHQATSEKHGDYTLGANWKLTNGLTVRAELFQKSHKDAVLGTLQSNNTSATAAPASYLLNLKYTGTKLTAVAKPANTLAFTTRLVYQKSEGDVTGTPGVDYTSLYGTNYQISETVDFNPTQSVYFQVAGTMVFNYISTIYPRAGVYPAASATAAAYDVNRVLQNSINNYSTLSALAGMALAAHTDVVLQFTSYKASNGNATSGLYTVPYGVAASDTTTTIGIKHMFSDKLVMNAKVGYIDSKNDTTGGYTNYKGPMAYVAFDHAL